MKFSAQTQHRQPNQDDSVIPLINVVFLMLIFFMVAGQVQRSDVVKLEPPSSRSEIKMTDKPLEILVADKAQLYLDNQPTALDSLKDNLSQAFEQAADKEKFSVLVKVDATLPVEDLQAVLSEIKAAGLTKIALATQQKPNKEAAS